MTLPLATKPTQIRVCIRKTAELVFGHLSETIHDTVADEKLRMGSLAYLIGNESTLESSENSQQEDKQGLGWEALG